MLTYWTLNRRTCYYLQNWMWAKAAYRPKGTEPASNRMRRPLKLAGHHDDVPRSRQSFVSTLVDRARRSPGVYKKDPAASPAHILLPCLALRTGELPLQLLLTIKLLSWREKDSLLQVTFSTATLLLQASRVITSVLDHASIPEYW